MGYRLKMLISFMASFSHVESNQHGPVHMVRLYGSACMAGLQPSAGAGLQC